MPADTASPCVLEDRHGAVAVLTLAVPARRNALSLALRMSLLERLEALAQDDTVRALVLTGAGGHFCAGGDLSEMQDVGFAQARERLRPFHALVRHLIAGARPVVAAVEGWAAGAGLSLALACDQVVASSEARFAASFGNVGLVADLGLLHSLPRRVGEGLARRMLLLAEPVDAATGLARGLVDELVPPGEALTAAIALAQRFASRAPLAIALTKARLAEGLEPVLAWEREAQATVFGTADHAEGKAAFFAKRPPLFRGV